MIQVIGKIGKASEQDKIEFLISHLSFERIGETLYAVMPSMSQPGETHRVTIDETGEQLAPVECNCWGFSRHGHCINVKAVQEYYTRQRAEREAFHAPRRPQHNALLIKQRELYRAGRWHDGIGELTSVESSLHEAIHEYLNEYAILGATKVTSEKQVKDYCDCCGKECDGGICGKCLA